jgi:hypothetical protein
MFNHRYLAPALLLTAAVAFTPASAAVVVITQAKANAGGVTPGDAPGFPVTLSLPGAYQFDTNLTVPANRNGIVVTSHYVDIDMNGFLLLGANASGVKVAFHGVISGYGDGHIHDGIISSFKGTGIFLVAAPNSNAWVVEDMQIVGNDQYGIRADASHYLRLSNNLILVNGQAGIVCGEYCHAEGNTLADNGFARLAGGIELVSGTVLGNSIFSNDDGSGIVDEDPDTDVGYGNNTVSGNGAGGDQVYFGIPLHPNACVPSC